ncbi:pentatricopeptide repeat-containing protein At4g18520, chloroplastic-like [Cryptomeria japonica]|uniref:pentatricopeptide repeat-containing protein At4g18520, chloroplastic-like n=1 Tax=Cryptomeria japonica TaxID=3369 RepID=UPI0027D9E276|nr:pentatricopeptide repeat-containing protein At4g18520, chloroplastic-like [Cryptomeria japonica]
MAVAITACSTFEQYCCHSHINNYEQINTDGKRKKKKALSLKLLRQTNYQTYVNITNNKGFRGKITKLCILKEAMEFLYLTEQPQLWVDTNMYASLLQACIELEAFTEGFLIHSHMIKINFKPNMYLNNILLSMYVKFGKLLDGRRVFDKMPQKNRVSWTTLIAGYAQNGFADEALELFSEMHCQGVKANAVTFVCVVSVMAELEAVKLGRQVHGCIIKSECLLNMYLESALVYLYSNCGYLEDALQIFDQMSEREVTAWTVMIAGYAKHEYGEEALRLFNEMKCEGNNPNEYTVTSTLKACGELNALREGKHIHAFITKRKIRQDVYVDSALIDMYVKCGCVSGARKVFDRIPSHNNVSWTSMIAGYAQNGFGKDAISLFRQMLRSGTKPNNFTLVSVLKACVLLKTLKHGKQVHAQIIKNEYEMNTLLLNTLVGLYANCGNLIYARKVFLQLPIRDVVSWTTIIEGHVKQGHGEEALTLFARMLGEGMEPNEFTFTSILRACATLEALEEGKQIHGYINKAQFESDVYVGSALMDVYIKCGNLASAHHVFDRISEPNQFSWNVIIEGYLRHGYRKEALKLICQMHKSGMTSEDEIIVSVLNSYAGNIVG